MADSDSDNENSSLDVKGNLTGRTLTIKVVAKSEHEVIYEQLHARIASWTIGGDGDDVEKNRALEELKRLRKLFREKENMVESLSSDILSLQRLIKKEKEDRKKETEDLKKRVGQLEKDKQDLRRVMLVRSLATATQFAITKKFGGLFSSRYAYSTTVDDVRAKVNSPKCADPLAANTFNAITKLFVDQGVAESDIAPLIKTIREVGTDYSHPMEMVNADGSEYQPDYTQMKEIIDFAPLTYEMKADAQILLNVLKEIQAPSCHYWDGQETVRVLVCGGG